MFDGEAFGAQMVEIVRGYVAAEIEPLRAENKALADRVAELEAREVLIPEKGDPGEPGRDGIDADVEQILVSLQAPMSEQIARETERQIAAAIAALPPAEKGDPGENGVDGESVDMAVLGAIIDAKFAELPAAKDGKDGHDVEDIEVTQDGATVEFAFTVGDTRSTFEIQLPEGPQGQKGPAGKDGLDGSIGRLEQAKAWADEVHYAGAVRTHLGGTWQAVKDTAKEPPHEDWICIAAAGSNGEDGKSLNPRRLWSADEKYKHLDVVALNGGSFVAVKDDPGACPGDGWMLITSPGKRGEKGERGGCGEQGLPGPAVIAAVINDEGVQTLVNGDGTTVECDLYPVLSRIEGR